jgi:hypothetical protein
LISGLKIDKESGIQLSSASQVIMLVHPHGICPNISKESLISYAINVRIATAKPT